MEWLLSGTLIGRQILGANAQNRTRNGDPNGFPASVGSSYIPSHIHHPQKAGFLWLSEWFLALSPYIAALPTPKSRGVAPQ